MAKQFAIVGGGVAGLAACETLRELDSAATIHWIGGERPYARMVLPYLMEGRIEEAAVFTGDDAYFDERNIETRFGTRVAALDPAAKQLELEGGDSLSYDSLLIATGSRASKPPIRGVDGDGVVNLWTLEDARAFLAGRHRDVVILGAGFIAFTILDAVLHVADHVHLVELEEHVLPRMVDAAAAEMMENQLSDAGVSVRTRAEVMAIEEADGRRRVVFANGESIEADAVILATGIETNSELARQAGIETDAGILVDNHLQTSAEGIYAAGDVAQGPILHLGERLVHAIQPTAVDHGRVAAANMAGHDVEYEGSLLMNILAVAGLEAASFGAWGDDSKESHLVHNSSNRIYRKLLWDGDCLVGAVIVGPTHAMTGQNDIGMLKGLIQSGVGLGAWKSYLEENPLDLRRAYVASGAAQELLNSTLLAGRVSVGGGFRFPRLPARRTRSPHHATLVANAPS